MQAPEFGAPARDDVQVILDAKPAETQKFLCEFIEIYQGHPCLWKYSCKDYRNRVVKEKAYSILVDKMREIDPRADKNSVMRKINALRTAFRREFKKVRRATSLARVAANNNSRPKNKYVPSLWYYDLLRFVVDQQDHTEPPPGAAIGGWQDDTIADGFGVPDEDGKLEDHHGEALMEFLEDTPVLAHAVVKLEPTSPSSSRAASPVCAPAATSTSGPALSLEIDAVYSEKGGVRREDVHEPGALWRPRRPLPTSLLQQQEPPEQGDLDRFGAYVAMKLKRSTRKQSIIAEKVIAEVLMRANLGTLDEGTALNEPRLPLAPL